MKMTTQQLTSEIACIAEANHLSKPFLVEGTTPANLKREAIKGFIVAFGLFVFLGLFISGIIWLGMSASNEIDIKIVFISFLVCICFGLLFGLLPPFAMLFSSLLYLCDDGLLRYYPFKKTTQIVRWEQITTVLSNGGRYTIRYQDKGELYISPNDEYGDELIELINHEVLQRKLPALLERHLAGQEVQFGKIMLDQQGITYKKQTYAWSQVGSAKASDGFMVIRRRRSEDGPLAPRLFTCPLVDVPNYCVLMALIEALQQ